MTEPTMPDGALDPALLAEVLHHALDGVAVLDSVAGRPRIVVRLRPASDWGGGRPPWSFTFDASSSLAALARLTSGWFSP
mgnify:CR=1 FL=1